MGDVSRDAHREADDSKEVAEVSEATEWLRIDDPDEVSKLLSEELRSEQSNRHYTMRFKRGSHLPSETESWSLYSAWRVGWPTEPAIDGLLPQRLGILRSDIVLSSCMIDDGFTRESQRFRARDRKQRTRREALVAADPQTNQAGVMDEGTRMRLLSQNKSFLWRNKAGDGQAMGMARVQVQVREHD